jgi:RNA polymerase sigma-70 factor (ECF subfamily)
MNNDQKILFNSLHTQYHGMVMQVCLGYMNGNRYLAEDLVQEVFINTWNALSNFRGDSSHKTWIYRITVNTCLLYIRDKKDVQNSLDEEQVQHLPFHENEPKKYDSLYKAIGELPPVERLIIMMFLEELEYEEISKIIGITEINLRVKIHRIKKKLKELLK